PSLPRRRAPPPPLARPWPGPVTAAGEVIGVDHDRAAVDTAEQRTLGLELTTRRAVATGCFTEEGARSRLHHLSSCTFLAAMTLHIVVAES
ncbi:hypothetical protein ACFU9V_34860, partial [Streptomyces sp. NPDC057557]